MDKSCHDCIFLKTFGLLVLLVLFASGCAVSQFGRPLSQPASPPASITIEPVKDTNPVRTQHTLKATVRNAGGKPVHSAMVEWILARTPGAVGDIVEAGQDPLGRALKLTNTYALTGTDTNGETWITITSVHEGITDIIVVAHDIKDKTKHKAFAVKYWLDAKWEFPAPGTNKVGTKHTMATKVVKASNGEPLEGYNVRWQVASGPAAVFAESRKPVAVTKTDKNGIAKATLIQASPRSGTNNIGITIIKPKDPGRACCPTPSGVIARGATTKTWVAPTISIQKSCPSSIVLGDAGQFSLVVSNTSRVEAEDVVVKDTLPEGFEYVSSVPKGKVDGRTVTWELGDLDGGASKRIMLTAKPTNTGRFTNEVTATTKEGLRAKSACPITVTKPALTISKTCPSEGVVGDSLNFVVTARNTGTAPATNVVVTESVPEGMKHASGKREVTWNIGTMAPGASVSNTFVFVAEKTGEFTNTADISADRGLKDQTECKTVIRAPRISIKKSGPEKRFLGRTATYTIVVSNPGTAPATGVTVSDTVPSGMSYVSATPAGTYNPSTRAIIWNLGTLAPDAERSLELTLKAESEGRHCDEARVQTGRGLRDSAQACTVVEGISALLLEVADEADPIEVGAVETYTIVVTNQGTKAGTNLIIVVVLPDELEYVSSTGPTAARSVGKRVSFAPVGSLGPKEKITYSVRAKGLEPGDIRLTVDMTSDQLRRYVREEESTTIYR